MSTPFRAHDFEYSYLFDLAIILKSIPVLIYNGNYDFIVNFYGQSEMLAVMEWPGQEGFAQASV